MRKIEKDFRERNILFVDLETSGLDIDEHEILEVGCLLVNSRTLKIIRKYNTKVKPTHIESAEKEGIEVSGYSPEKWVDAKPLKLVLEEISQLAPGAMVAGWKVDFDWWFLDRAFKRNKITHTFDYHLIDIISIAWAYYRNKKRPRRLGLRKISKVMGIKLDNTRPHNAMKDIEATYEVFKKLVRRVGT